MGLARSGHGFQLSAAPLLLFCLHGKRHGDCRDSPLRNPESVVRGMAKCPCGLAKCKRHETECRKGMSHE
ncbi:hypothetical protein Y88_2143 [Novosphingobium nitrogenifigens DSM 19370]|uniref:Uncharacterized protein n=1 Tax=Novosphingobium nitrogenifigens DSM 19370 TaxID=983920 RepID=F1Z589_9SPHN|nr:hypothetical protein Y88_2143 [Novosphingobium nitrogenifigens DSM 19370]